MNQDIIGVIYSVILITFCIALSFVVSRKGKKVFGDLCSEVARKIVHIGVANWFFIYVYVFKGIIYPIIGLGVFAFLNGILNVKGYLKPLMGQENKKRNWGLVQYPVSIIIMLLLSCYNVGDLAALGCGLLGMGYGDGLASLCGMKFGKTKLYKGSDKSVIGSVVMTITVFIIVSLIQMVYGAFPFGMGLIFVYALLIGLIASTLEAITPYGLDNLSVPLAIYFMSFVLFR